MAVWIFKQLCPCKPVGWICVNCSDREWAFESNKIIVPYYPWVHVPVFPSWELDPFWVKQVPQKCSSCTPTSNWHPGPGSRLQLLQNPTPSLSALHPHCRLICSANLPYCVALLASFVGLLEVQHYQAVIFHKFIPLAPDYYHTYWCLTDLVD